MHPRKLIEAVKNTDIAIPLCKAGIARAFGEAHRRDTRMKNFEEGVHLSGDINFRGDAVL